MQENFILSISVDENYWVMEKNKEKNKILFIGNDGREYDFALNIALLPEYDFCLLLQILNNNVKSSMLLVKGQWNQKLLTDSEIKEFIINHISIIPIRNSYQPLKCGFTIHVNNVLIITETIGFWDKDVFIDNVNIFFVSENKLDIWTKKIRDVLTNEIQTKLVIDNSKKLISEKYNTDLFYRKIKKVIFSSD